MARMTRSGHIVTLEMDIFDAFRKHGLTVVKEEVKKDKWIITAIRK